MGTVTPSRRAARRFASTQETVQEAAARLGVSRKTIPMRLAYGWTEEEALSVARRARVPRGYKAPKGARPGVKRTPLTRTQMVILQCLADGFTPREIHDGGLGKSLHALHQHMHRMRLKLDAFTSFQMGVEAALRGLIKRKEQP